MKYRAKIWALYILYFADCLSAIAHNMVLFKWFPKFPRDKLERLKEKASASAKPTRDNGSPDTKKTERDGSGKDASSELGSDQPPGDGKFHKQSFKVVQQPVLNEAAKQEENHEPRGESDGT